MQPNVTARSPDTPQDVADWLVAHPRFLAENPALYARLDPPRRVHGDRLADHMAAMLAAARAESLDAAASRGRADAFAARVQAAVLALIEQPDPLATITEDWPRLLDLAGCALRSEAPTHRAPLPPGTIAALLPPGQTLLRRDTPDPGLHGEPAPLVVREAILRLATPNPAILVLGARHPAALPTRGTTASLLFLAATLSAALAR